ncbi:MAG: TlpA disulfide reductase family protein [Bacteroidota bacterium]
MRTYLTFLLSLLSITCFSQEISVKEVLTKTDSAIRGINTISYWIDHELRYFTNEDTIDGRAICHLQAAPKDSLKIYHNVVLLSEARQQVYNGASILHINLKDSSSLIFDPKLHGYGSIKGNLIGKLIQYDLFTESVFSKKLQDTALVDYSLAETIFDNQEVYAVSFEYKYSDEFEDDQATYFIRKSDFFPIGYEASVYFQNMLQYRSYSLSNISVNTTFEDKLFDLDYNIIDKTKVKNFIPKRKEPFLLSGTDAPEIDQATILGKDFQLKDHKGKIVILDFWYRSCYPCIKALPDLQRIASESSPDDVLVVGVNPFDNKEQIVSFLREKNITYTNIYQAKNIVADYKVSAYPTYYIIDKQGRIYSAHEGWSDTFYDDLIKKINSIK